MRLNSAWLAAPVAPLLIRTTGPIRTFTGQRRSNALYEFRFGGCWRPLEVTFPRSYGKRAVSPRGTSCVRIFPICPSVSARKCPLVHLRWSARTWRARCSFVSETQPALPGSRQLLSRIFQSRARPIIIDTFGVCTIEVFDALSSTRELISAS